MDLSGYRYQPYYCEENAYFFCRDLLDRGEDPEMLSALFITNQNRCCLLNHQKAAPPGAPVLWDYHVILLQSHPPASIVDPDCRLGLTLPAMTYLNATFPVGIPLSLRPLFRVVPAMEFMETFASDRRHMRYPDGSWHQPPPPWQPPHGPHPPGTHTLPLFLRTAGDDPTLPGELITLEQLRRRV